MIDLKAQAVVVGGGSGGFGALYSLAKAGTRVILLEKNKGLGGTSVFGGVNCYEPGVCCGALHRLLAAELSKIPYASAVCRTVPNSQLFFGTSTEHDFQKYPWGLSVPDGDCDYAQTLKRCLSLTKGEASSYRRYQFEPAQMQYAMQTLLWPYRKNITLLFETELVECCRMGRTITEIKAVQNGETLRIRADYFIDATGDLFLSRYAGCSVSVGADSRNTFGEPSALETEDKRDINGVSYVFRIRKDEDPNHMDMLPTAYPCKKPVVSCFNVYPNSDINVNMLPTMKGRAYLSLGDEADAVGRDMVYGYWNWLQKEKGLRGYRLMYVFPQPGIREHYRLNGRYTLTEQDIRLGLQHQQKQEEIVAIADHAMDSHGSGGCREIERPYGIPLSCMLPNEYDNLFVACRGASFSHIAASSARLSRTILSMGEAAGTAVSMLIQQRKIDFCALQDSQNLYQAEKGLRITCC